MIEPDLHHGEPCIRGTRIPVSVILGSLADNMTYAEIQQAYPQLQTEDIRVALAYAAERSARGGRAADKVAASRNG